MKIDSLDKFFKDKLSQLDGGDSLNTWDMLSDKMDTQSPFSPIEDSAFDQKIKDAIGSITVIEMPAWQSFVSNLDLEENLEEIESDIQLDNSIKNNLDDLNPAYEDSSWDLLEQRLDTLHHADLETKDLELDQVSYEKLLNYTVPQKAGDWEALDKELDKEFVLPYKLLFKYKFAELAILASLILIFFQAKPYLEKHVAGNQTNIESAKVETIKPIASTITKPIQESSKITNSKALANVQDKVNTSIAIPSSSLNNSIVSSSENKVIVSTDINSDSESINYIANSASTSKSSDIILIDNDEYLETNTIATAIVKSRNEQIPTQETPPQLVQQTADTPLPTNAVFNLLSKLPTGSLVNLPYNGKGVNICLLCDTDKTILDWRLGAHVDAAYTVIMTPFDQVLNLDSYNHATVGYGAGLSTSLLLGSWELESGFSYASRSYSPDITESVGTLAQGFLQIELSKLEMNILSIPLHLRYHFNKKLAKTHFYMHGGASMHVAVQTNHFIDGDFLGNNKRPDQTVSKKLLEESEISDKIFSDGWFEGGSFIENRYYTFNVGLGFERKISKRYSIFGQTTYAQFLDSKGIGPNNDRFNSVKFSTGVRALFK